MGASPLRYKRLIEEIPKHKHAEQALLAAGFSKQTARTKAKRVLRATLRHQAKEVLKSPNDLQNSKQLMHEIVGMSPQELFSRLRWAALENDKDMSTGLKIIAPLVKQLGVILSADDDQKNVTVPILNVIVGAPSSPIEAKPVEVLLPTIEIKEEYGSVEP